MTKHLTSFLALSAAYLLGSSAFAAEIVTAKTTGMTCEECADTVKTKLMKNDAVESVKVDVDTGTVVVTVKDGAEFSEEDMTAVIDWAGYDIVEMSRSETA
jgi:copper chaperone CopZ